MLEPQTHIFKPTKKIHFYLLVVLLPVLIFTGILILTIKKTPQKEAFATQNEVPEIAKEITIGSTKINVDIADTEAKRQKGLGGKTSLQPNHGMLFVFSQKNTSPRFWMKDMLFAIDIIWIKDNKISQIDKNVPAPDPNTSEFNLKFYLPNDPIDYVLEVSAGFSDTNNFKVGDPADLSQI